MQSDGKYQLVTLANGARSIHSVAYHETFHPVIGPAQEAEALYVRQLRLLDRLQVHQNEFVVWDVGLGAAANVLALLRASRHLTCRIRVISFDQTLEPLRFALRHARELDYLHSYESLLSRLLEQSGPPVRWVDEGQEIHWQAVIADFPSFLTSPDAEAMPKPHAILFDAFSPATNPAMWTYPLFSRLYQLLDPRRPCALPTYSRSTMLRVTLLLAGFFVGKGHATGEKEETTIAANSLGLIDEPLDSRWLKRVRNSTSAEPLSQAIYRQSPLTALSWQRLIQHPQFHPT